MNRHLFSIIPILLSSFNIFVVFRHNMKTGWKTNFPSFSYRFYSAVLILSTTLAFLIFRQLAYGMIMENTSITGRQASSGMTVL